MATDYKQSIQELAKAWDKLDTSGSEFIKQADQRRRKGGIAGAIELYTRSINLLKPREEYERGIARVGLGICYMLQEDPNESNVQKAKEVLASAARNLRGRSPMEGMALLFLCIAQQAEGSPESLDEALRTCMQAETALEAEALQGKARQRARELSDLIAEKPKEEATSTPAEPTPSPSPDGLPQFESLKLVRIPILGEIAAGPLMLAEEHIEGYLPVREDRARGVDFALRVKGDSMAGAGIQNDDVVLIHSQSYADNGDIVVAMVLDQMEEFALKRFCYHDNRIHLWSEPSEEHREEYLNVDQEDQAKVQVLGKVVTA